MSQSAPSEPDQPIETIEPHPDAAPITRRRFVHDSALYAAGLGGLGASLLGCGGGTEPEGTFGHGVASGDPLADRVVLWTRVTQSAAGSIEVGWEVARDAVFAGVVASGTTSTSAARDYTVKVDAGGLQPGTTYHYRFRFRDELSPIGRTKTLPAGAVGQVRLAVMSCAAYPAGQFHAYADAARRGDIDAAVLLGDYIYESDLSRGLEFASRLLGRNWEPDRELITLEDYRARHGFYRGDFDLKSMHAAMPVIAVWDDHDLINGIWRDGASAHDPSKGSFTARRAAAMQAFQEWLPIRMPDPATPMKIYRRFDFGNLATLHMLDARARARPRRTGLARGPLVRRHRQRDAADAGHRAIGLVGCRAADLPGNVAAARFASLDGAHALAPECARRLQRGGHLGLPVRAVHPAGLAQRRATRVGGAAACAVQARHLGRLPRGSRGVAGLRAPPRQEPGRAGG